MTRRLFGTDGVRGVAGEEPLTAETASALGRAVALHFSGGTARPGVVVGRDTRLSGDMLEAAICAGLCAAGADVTLVGEVPTPTVAYLTRAMGVCAGVMISASHNPFADNGIKLFSGDGFKLSDAAELEIERGITAPEVQGRRRTGLEIGRITRSSEAAESYLAHLRRAAGAGLRLDGLKVVLDAGNGAAYRLGPALLESLGAEVVSMGVCPDGQNINDRAGALHPQTLQAKVIECGASLGVALDGDADRAILVDERGQIQDGDACLALCASAMLKADQLPGRTVVATQMSNLGLEHYLREIGVRLLRTQVGDRYVVEAMRAGGHPLGGEQSGHIIFLEHASTGDGLLTALQVAGILVRARRPFSELVRQLQRYPQVLLNVRLKKREPLESLPGVMRAIEQVERTLGSEGRVLVRFSGTEPLARVMIEGTDPVQIDSLAREIADEIARVLA